MYYPHGNDIRKRLYCGFPTVKMGKIKIAVEDEKRNRIIVNHVRLSFPFFPFFFISFLFHAVSYQRMENSYGPIIRCYAWQKFCFPLSFCERRHGYNKFFIKLDEVIGQVKKNN